MALRAGAGAADPRLEATREAAVGLLHVAAGTVRPPGSGSDDSHGQYCHYVPISTDCVPRYIRS
jgi:hypothetical protein